MGEIKAEEITRVPCNRWVHIEPFCKQEHGDNKVFLEQSQF